MLSALLLALLRTSRCTAGSLRECAHSFDDPPRRWMSASAAAVEIGDAVHVQLSSEAGGGSVWGLLVAHDPVSRSLVVATATEGQDPVGVRILFPDAIATLSAEPDARRAEEAHALRERLLSSAGSDPSVGSEGGAAESDAVLGERRRRLVAWLTKARVPFAEPEGDGVSCVIELFGGAASIRAPFTPEASSAASPLILQRVRKLAHTAAGAAAGGS